MKGFTLIELLIVIIISMLVIVITLSTILLGSRVYSDREKSTELLQNGRVLLDVVSREVRQAKRIITTLPEEKEDAVDELVFQDGHLSEITEEGILQGGEENVLKLENDSNGSDDYYKDAYIKVYYGGDYDIKRITEYNGSTKEALIEKPLDSFDESYNGLSYVIDTRYYYVHYYLNEKGLVERKVFTYYFSSDSNLYVPHNATPSEGETSEVQVLQSPEIIAEHVESILFWGTQPVNIFLKVKKNSKEIDLIHTVFSRNI